jgi:predicted DNA binding CopG/RHH family protein
MSSRAQEACCDIVYYVIFTEVKTACKLEKRNDMSSRKEMARIMMRNRIGMRHRARRERAEPQQPSTPEPASAPEVPKHSVFNVPDSWKPHTRPGAPPVLNDDEVKVKSSNGAKKKAKHKRRRNSLNICVSDEEAYLIKQFASDQGMNLSQWAREVMFHAMRKQIPDRT